jgi:enoyl-CoA hydratase/carnithine racemase
MSVRYERKGAAVWLTIDRADAANALSRAVVDGLRDGIRRASSEDCRAIVIAGAGDKAFCAGADLKERRGMSADETRKFLDDLNAMMNDVAATPRVVIAAVGGVALGGGTELALACDVRVANERAQFGLTEVRLGIIPGAGGTQRLARIVGVARAKEMILFGGRVDAQRALAIGLVNEVGDLETIVAKRVDELAACAPIAVAKAKEAIDRGFDLPIAEGLALERACYEVTLTTEDRQEGLRAFGEKRKPEFKGR